MYIIYVNNRPMSKHGLVPTRLAVCPAFDRVPNILPNIPLTRTNVGRLALDARSSRFDTRCYILRSVRHMKVDVASCSAWLIKANK